MANRSRRLITLVLLLLVLPVSAAAVQTGSLMLQEIRHPVILYRVAGADGTLSGAFADYPENPPFEDPEKEAKQLQTYALQNRIKGQTSEPEDGDAFFESLEEGLYLVCSLRERAEFAPFLLNIPTQLNGKTIYHIQAKPKQEDPPPETGAAHPTEKPSDSVIPQTGNSVIPRYSLMILGSAITLVGLYEVIRGREEQFDD